MTETGHQTTLFEPEDATEGPREKDTLDRRETDHTIHEGRVFVIDPCVGPLGFFLDTGDRVDRIEQSLLLDGILDICVDQQRVCFGVYVFDRDLEAIEKLGFQELALLAEALHQIFIDDPVGGREEGQDVLDEVLLVVVQALFHGAF